MNDNKGKEVDRLSAGRQVDPKEGSCVLFAEDEEDLRVPLAHTLRQSGYSVIECVDGPELTEFATSVLDEGRRHRVDLIVADARMPWITVVEVLRGARECFGHPPLVLITAFPNEETRAHARRLGPALMLKKPFEMDYFLEVIRTIVPPGRQRAV